MEAKICPFKPKHAKQCTALVKTCARFMDKRSPGYTEHGWKNWLEEHNPENFLGKATGPDSVYWVAEHRGRVVGIVGLARRSDKSAEQVNFYVHPDFVGKGIGKKLFEVLNAHAKNAEIKMVFLRSSYFAHDIYVKLGFVHNPDGDVYSNRCAAGFSLPCSCGHAPRSKGRRLVSYYFEKTI